MSRDTTIGVAVALLFAALLPACGDDAAPAADVPSWAKVAPEQVAEAKEHGVPVSPPAEDEAPEGVSAGLPESRAEFAVRLRKILERVVDLTAPFAVLSIREFHEILVHARDFRPLVDSALRDAALQEECRAIAVLALQRLPDTEYMDFCGHTVSGLAKGEVPARVARWALFLDPRWCVSLQRNFQDDRVVSILGDYQRICPESTRAVQHVLSGKCWFYTQKLRKTGELPVWTDNEFYD